MKKLASVHLLSPWFSKIELKKKYELTLLYSDTILILTPQVTEYFWPSRHNFLDIDMTYYMILTKYMCTSQHFLCQKMNFSHYFINTCSRSYFLLVSGYICGLIMILVKLPHFALSDSDGFVTSDEPCLSSM